MGMETARPAPAMVVRARALLGAGAECDAGDGSGIPRGEWDVERKRGMPCGHVGQAPIRFACGVD